MQTKEKVHNAPSVLSVDLEQRKECVIDMVKLAKPEQLEQIRVVLGRI